jgi:hypothetical protein
MTPMTIPAATTIEKSAPTYFPIQTLPCASGSLAAPSCEDAPRR